MKWTPASKGISTFTSMFETVKLELEKLTMKRADKKEIVKN